MSKRTDKKKQKKINDIAVTVPVNAEPEVKEVEVIKEVVKEVPVIKEVVKEVPVIQEIIKEVPAKKEHDADFYIQFNNDEYLAKDVIANIKAKLASEGTTVSADNKLSIYLKPQDRKAYYTYMDINGSIDL